MLWLRANWLKFILDNNTKMTAGKAEDMEKMLALLLSMCILQLPLHLTSESEGTLLDFLQPLHNFVAAWIWVAFYLFLSLNQGMILQWTLELWSWWIIKLLISRIRHHTMNPSCKVCLLCLCCFQIEQVCCFKLVIQSTEALVEWALTSIKQEVGRLEGICAM